MEILSATEGQNKDKEQFNKQVDDLLDEIQDGLDSGSLSRSLEYFQNRLDKLAETYQKDEKIGRLRYKLYEAQAYLHYLRQDNDKALEFMQIAVSVRGKQFEDAGKFEDLILHENASQGNDKKSATDELPARRENISGWPAFFIFSLGMGALYNLYSGFTGWSGISSISADINAAYPNLHSLLVVEQIVPLLSAGAACALILLIIQRRKMARAFGICFFAAIIIWTFIDYRIAANMFANNPTALKALNTGESGGAHFILFDIIWMLYLILSKQMKRILTV